jgi:hypothetical protein
VNKDFKKAKSKIFITFYSRDTPNASKKNTIRNLNSEKLLKSKDLRVLKK